MAFSLHNASYDHQIDQQETENHKNCIGNINEQYFKHLIGKQGSRLKEIKSKFNDKVEIKIADKRINIRGSYLTNVLDCKKLINKLVDEIQVNGCLSKKSVDNHSMKRETLAMFIESNLHGSLIVKNGSGI